jgi:1-acyl-sn-glycerol-3-phosphate acyltransferase
VLMGTSKAASAVLRCKNQAEIHAVMHAWGAQMLALLGVKIQILGSRQPNTQPTLFVANHLSYLDVPLIMALAPVVFIAKKQLKSWPLFGPAMQTVGTVFVDRDSQNSRKNAADAVAPKILNDKQSVAIFTSGTTTMDEKKPWRWGAFVIAKRYRLTVQPIRIRYSPIRTASFINQDYFLTHLWGVASCRGGIQATVEFGEPLQIEDPEADAQKVWEWCRDGLV